MYVPLVRERVRVRDQGGEFLVTRVDYKREIAFVMHASSHGSAEQPVSFAQLFATWENPGRLDSASNAQKVGGAAES